MITNFEGLISKVKECSKKTVSVAVAEDDAVLEAVQAARDQGIADAILVGDEAKIRQIGASLNMNMDEYQIIDEPDHWQAALKAVKLAHDGVADMYMKGLLDTKSFLKSILDKEVGLRTGRPLSHVAVFEVKGVKQLLFLTDVAFMTYPTLEDKVHIIENTVEVRHACGLECPKVAPLAAVEVVNPKMPATVEAAELTKMNEEARLRAASWMARCPWILPSIRPLRRIRAHPAGRLWEMRTFCCSRISTRATWYIRLWVHTATVENGCILTGTKVPAILTSRSDSFQTKVNSIALAAVVAEGLKKA